jgi:hypothetical protein
VTALLHEVATRLRTSTRRLQRERSLIEPLDDSDEVHDGVEVPDSWSSELFDEAIRRRIISREDAVLICRTRLGDEELERVATEIGVSYNALQKRRRHAEVALRVFLEVNEDDR